MERSTVEAIGVIATCLTTPSFIPQAIKVIRTKHTRDLSLITYVMMTAGTLGWLIYGSLINSPGLIIGNSISFVLLAIILVLKIRHG